MRLRAMETTDNFDDSWLCRNGSFERTQIDIVREQQRGIFWTLRLFDMFGVQTLISLRWKAYTNKGMLLQDGSSLSYCQNS